MDADLSFDQFIRCQILLLSCSISEQSPYISYSQIRKQHCCFTDSIKVQLIYCNSLLIGLPQTQSKRLQAAQNAAAETENITPILRELHWLPVSSGTYPHYIGLPVSSWKHPGLSDLLHISTPLSLALSDQRLDLYLMFPSPGILRQSNTTSEPSGMSPPPPGMPCLET